MQWHHSCAALGGNLLLTAVVVAIPIFYLFWALAIQRMKGYIAGVSTLLITIVLTVVVYQMPVSASLAAAGLGMTTGLLPHRLDHPDGGVPLQPHGRVGAVRGDQELDLLPLPGPAHPGAAHRLFVFGLHGRGGRQGAPVAVAAAMLIGLGFPAIPAAVICLIANTPPVPFGPVGVPTIMMSTVTGISERIMAQGIGVDMALMALVIPFFMVVVMAGFKNAKDVLPAVAVTSVSYAVDLLRDVVELRARAAGHPLLVRLAGVPGGVPVFFGNPSHVWRFPRTGPTPEPQTAASATMPDRFSRPGRPS